METEPKPKFTNLTEPKTENLQTDPPLDDTRVINMFENRLVYHFVLLIVELGQQVSSKGIGKEKKGFLI